MSNYRVVVIDRRGCRYVAAYYKTFYLASKFLSEWCMTDTGRTTP